MNLYTEPVKPTKKKRRPPSDDESEVSTAATYRLYVTSVLVCGGGVHACMYVHVCVCTRGCVHACMHDGDEREREERERCGRAQSD